MRSRHARTLLTAAVLATAICGWTLMAQAPPTPQSTASTPANTGSKQPSEQYPAPTNLQALPKTMTGQQVHDLMEQWSRDLNAKCDACHAYNHRHLGPDGKPVLNYADDSKDLKRVARMMVTMTDQMNTNYIAKVHGSGVAVSCGMCHRGEIGAEPYAPTQTVKVSEREIQQVDCAEQQWQKATK